jgi:hypothetical protein
MTLEDQVFVADVLIIDLTREMLASNVISQPTSVDAELNAIVKIRKYRRFHEWCHFILMAMEVHNAPEQDMNRLTSECARLFHNRLSRSHLSLSFCIQFLKQCVSIVLQHDLTFAIKRKIALASDACSRPSITIR